MRLWIFIFLMVSCSNGIQLRETEYECGAHGRFEYCIDGIPGCVIGCHCHPGYYFDTDTKICESNVRLSQNYRRNYEQSLEPTRVVIPSTPPTIEEPGTTVPNAVDEKIEIIAKDADDLGDWLYNQFFKTIENQVMNETKDDTIITRRSESAPTILKKPTRRSHKYLKARRKKKKKKKGIKSKLLRITEDDSLFDSSSTSSSDESSDSSDDSTSSSEESCEKDKKKKKSHDHDGNDHGHKKIVVYNKRPKQPLPSFIFLPNMETPFFPPIGLPPPPIPMYPMVPVPPMMGSFPCPAPPTPASTTTTEAPTHSSQNPSHDTVPEKDQPEDNKNSNENNPDDHVVDNSKDPLVNNPPDHSPDNQPPSLLRGGKKRKGPRNKLVQKLREKLKRKNKLQNYFAKEYQEPPVVPSDFMQAQLDHLPNLRQKTLPEINFEDELASLQDVDFKYLSQLIHRADLNKTNQILKISTPAPTKDVTVIPPHRRNYYDNYPDQITRVISDLSNQPKNHLQENQPFYDTPNQLYSAAQQPTYNSQNQPPYNILDPPIQNIPDQPNYNLANLPNNKLPNLPDYNPPDKFNYNSPNHQNNKIPNHSTHNSGIQPSHNASNQPTYISLNQPVHKVPYRKKIEETNDVYYANLGRQIASMIRNIDDKEIDIEIKSSSNVPNNPVLPDHGGSRSYWERFARSPYKHIMNSYKKQINILKLSNENLFNLESQVEVAASTEPTLNLQQLENIISKMHKTKSKFIQRNGSINQTAKPSKSSFNVNLLPGNDQLFNSNGKANNKAHNIRPKLTNTNYLFNNSNIRKQHSYSPSQLPIVPRSSLHNEFIFTLQAPGNILNATISKKTNTIQTFSNASITIPSKKPERIVVPQLMYKISNPHFNSYTYTAPPQPKKLPVLTNMQQPYVESTTSRTYYHQLSPMVLNHKAVKQYGGINNNHYVYEKASIPIRPQAFQISRIAQASPYDNYRKRVKPSFFHHELHHFDYFEDLL